VEGQHTILSIDFIMTNKLQDIVKAFDHLREPALFASWNCWISNESWVEYIMRDGQLGYDITYSDFNTALKRSEH